MPCTIPIPGFMILSCESILTLECFCSSLQSCTHVIWARVAIKFSIFGQILGLAWHKMVCLGEKNPCIIVKKSMYNSHPRLYKSCSWTILTLECFCSNLQPFAHVIWAESPLELLFLAKIWVNLAENVEVGLKFHVWFPSQLSWPLLVNLFWPWNASAAACINVRMLFGPE